MQQTYVSGMTLKLDRVRRRVTGRALAEAMGVTGARVSNIESSQYPTEDTIRRYRAALDTCAPSPTSSTPEEGVA